MTHLTLFEQKTRCISDDEEYIALYESEGSYIYYVRNYAAQTEFLLLSMDLVMALDEKLRTVAGVYFTPHFSVLKHFESEVIQHVLTSALLPHFHYLFNCSVSKFIKRLWTTEASFSLALFIPNRRVQNLRSCRYSPVDGSMSRDKVQ